MTHLGLALAAYQQKHDIENRVMAAEIGISQSTLSRIKAGTMPDALGFAKIVSWLGWNSIMKRYPNVVQMTPQWTRGLWENGAQTELPDGRWVPARPVGYPSLRSRIYAAWMVLTGRADALVWPGQ